MLDSSRPQVDFREAPLATFETQRADFGARFSFGTPLHGAGKYPFCWASEVC